MWLCLFSSNAGSLRAHLKTHSGEKSNKCNQCDFASSQAVNLRRHLKTHSGEKSNKCNQCDYASAHAFNLRTHLKTHSGEKSNKCNQCDYASSQTGNLRRHMKSHSGTMHPMRQAILADILKDSEGKGPTWRFSYRILISYIIFNNLDIFLPNSINLFYL